MSLPTIPLADCPGHAPSLPRSVSERFNTAAPPSSELPCPGVYQQGRSYDRPDMQLDDSPLADAIALHLANHISPRRRARRIAGTLFILGCPGIGKTETVRAVASRHDVDLLITAGADYNGATEGAPVEKFHTAFQWMRTHSRTSRRPFALLIDDIDASILEERDDQERTVNSNLFIGTLRVVCDPPWALHHRRRGSDPDAVDRQRR